MLEELATGYALIEGPVWHQTHGLLFSDVHQGGVFALSSTGQISVAVEHRRGIGGMVLHERGGLVVGGRNVAYKGPAAEGTVVLLDLEGAGGGVGFNDLTTDAAGRIYVGSLGVSPFERDAEQLTGCLHMVDLDGSTHRLAEGIRLTNGLGFSPDGRRLYHSDTRVQKVFVYDVNEDGTVGERQTFAGIDRGGPDGLAVAEDGAVYVAIAGDSCVRVFAADGAERPRIEVPLPMVTSVCFGGDGLRELYIVTGSDGAKVKLAGSVFRMPVETPGLPVPVARVRLPL